MCGLRIGEILERQGVLSRDQVSEILAEQRLSHRPFGDLAERLFGVDGRVIEDAWVRQYAEFAGVTDLRGVKVEAAALRLLNRRQAWQFKMLPLRKDEDGDLHIATDEEHLVRGVNFASRAIDDSVMFVLAESVQLREFLMRHYPVPRHLAEFSEKLSVQ
jgi:hypothetical protein